MLGISHHALNLTRNIIHTSHILRLVVRFTVAVTGSSVLFSAYLPLANCAGREE